jgi:ribonucleoside-triphosphate reductase
MYKFLSFKLDTTSKAVKEIIKETNNKTSAIAEFTINRTYSRVKIDELGDPVGKETLDDIFVRTVNGAMSILIDRLREIQSFDECEIEDYAIRLYRGLRMKRITPAGRGLWTMGTKIVNQDRLGLPLVNCTFIESGNIDVVKEEFFHFVMDALMLGVGVGFDTEGTGKLHVYMPEKANYKKHNSYHIYIDQLRKFDDGNFLDETGESYILREIEYINDVLIAHRHRIDIHKIKDSREGWCEALCKLLQSYFYKGRYIIIFDYSDIRPEGTLLKGFGGEASGPKPLAELLAAIRHILHFKYIGKAIDELFIIDLCNLIARTVVAGNVRRSSEICLSKKFNIIDCKRIDKEEFKYRQGWAWNSNNSYTVTEELSLEEIRFILNNVKVNSEPGLFFRENCRKYGRIHDGIDNVDKNSSGTNPCGEVTLEGTSPIASNIPYSAGGETCNLGETFPSNYNFDFKGWKLDWDLLYNGIHGKINDGYADEFDNLKALISEYFDDLYIMNLYTKIVTLVPVHWKSTELIQDRNRRIGISMSGIAILLGQMGLLEDDKVDIIYEIGLEESITFKRFAVFLDACFKHVISCDEIISNMLDIPKSIKHTVIKPSGTVSICNDVPAGMHFPYSNYYIRRIRINTGKTDLINSLKRAGYNISYPLKEPNTAVVEFPVKLSHETLPRDKVTIDLQFKIYLYLQRYWANNSVSCTFTFKEHEFDRTCELISKHQGSMKGISCHPYYDDSRVVYEYAPNERISMETYNEMISKVKPIDYRDKDIVEIEYDTYCDGDKCYRVEKS